MHEDKQDISSYLSIRNESDEEHRYLDGLLKQYLSAIESESYHMALFAYHLLFMSFVYQTIHKIKIWLPEKFKLALITFPTHERESYINSRSPWAYSKIKERTIFGLFHLLEDCDDLISDCKTNTVDYRNKNLGHANPITVGSEEFLKKTTEYDVLTEKIQKITQVELDKLFVGYLNGLDNELEITKDDLETSLIIPNRMSDKDLECLSAECLINPSDAKSKTRKIIEEEYGVLANLI